MHRRNDGCILEESQLFHDIIKVSSLTAPDELSNFKDWKTLVA